MPQKQVAQLKAGTVAIPYLRAWREYRLLSRADLAKLSGVKEPTIEKIEMRRSLGSRYSSVRKLADALRITSDELLFYYPPVLQKALSQMEAPAVATSERNADGNPDS
jgi:transcriptional regulator with XRE-family HTH domain